MSRSMNSSRPLLQASALTCSVLAWGSTATAQAVAQGASPATVSSQDQKGGVTAQNIGTVTTNIMPPLVRGPHLEHFKSAFTEGARLLRQLQSPDVTDDEIKHECEAIVAWANDTIDWINGDLGPYAAERFAFQPGLSFSWKLNGEHKPGLANERAGCLNSARGWLTNIDFLMRDPSIYPEK